MENTRSKSNIKIMQNEVIENNIKFIEILFYIFKNQVLDSDLKEFCIKFQLYETENQYNAIIKKLISRKILKVKKLVHTNNNVIIAKAPVHSFFGKEGKTTNYSIETVTRNSYLAYLLIHKMSLNIANTDILDVVKYIENNTTLLSKKRDVESCYKAFSKLTEQGKQAKIEAIYREEKRKIKLKNIEKIKLEEMKLIYTETLQTLRERDIYFVANAIIITDNNSDYILSTLARKIAIAIKVLEQQVKVEDFRKLDIIILVKNESIKTRLENSFITRYQDKEKINLDIAINEALKKLEYRHRANFVYLKRKNDMYILENENKANLEAFQNIRVKIENTNIANKHNSDFKKRGLIEHKQKQKENNLKKQWLEELRNKGLLKEDISQEELDNI